MWSKIWSYKIKEKKYHSYCWPRYCITKLKSTGYHKKHMMTKSEKTFRRIHNTWWNLHAWQTKPWDALLKQALRTTSHQACMGHLTSLQATCHTSLNPHSHKAIFMIFNALVLKIRISYAFFPYSFQYHLRIYISFPTIFSLIFCNTGVFILP